ncbi:uncharacterized protein zgc:194627 [Puntigrus tetrazona]|uniref:uncharacterized protein zgc:194627 n=1 Tax=Puntigrus tetrazona TaxID=1606681 RepID=UPI001C8A9C04|nr:uncharacterized protein zgc:194627 [Puntigrus tetrazona]
MRCGAGSSVLALRPIPEEFRGAHFQIEIVLTLFLNATLDCNMYRRFRFIFLFALLIDTVSLYHVVESTEGSSVVLKCGHRRVVLEEQLLTVHWRHNDIRNVYDIIHGEVSVKEQDPAYKNRAEVLPEELKKGHVSLKLTDLQLSDGGTYLCFVPALGIDHSTQLVVKEQPLPKYAAVQIRSHGTGTRLGKILHLLIPLSGLILHFI